MPENNTAEIANELVIDGFHDTLRLDNDIFIQDTWDWGQALFYLVGLNNGFFDEVGQSHIQSMYGKDYNSLEHGEEVTTFLADYFRLKKLWDPAHHPERNPPEYYLEWAMRKGIVIPWLNFAHSKGFFVMQRPLGDREKSNYLKLIAALAKIILDPSRLSIPNQAKLIEYLVENYQSAGHEGFAKSQLEKTFPVAKRVLTSSI
jgi:hypothetical protein